MKTSLIIALTIVGTVALAAKTQINNTGVAKTTVTKTESTDAVKADNSAINKRDRIAAAPVADSQSMAASDTEVTRRIRENLMQTKGLSVYGQNVKIITNDGHVVLKGPVRTASERKQIEDIAITVAGSGHVSNQIDIVTK